MRSEDNSRPLRAWVYRHYGEAGDLYNGIAVASALDANYRVVSSEIRQNADGSYCVGFLDKGAGESQETIRPQDMPGVIIDPEGAPLSYHVFGKLRHMGVDKTLFVTLRKPDHDLPSVEDQIHYGIGTYHEAERGTTYAVPDYADMHFVFKHQLKPERWVPPDMYVADTVPTRVSTAALEQARQQHAAFLSGVAGAKPTYLLVLGDISGEGKDDAEAIQKASELSEQMVAAIQKTGGSLMVVTSPRTSHAEAVIEEFSKRVEGTGIHTFFTAMRAIR